MEKRKRKIKYISPPMKFNPGTEKFEPDLPLRNARKTGEREKNSWFWIILLIILMLLFITVVAYFY